MEKEELVKIFSERKKWLDKNVEAVTAKSNYNEFILDKATDSTTTFIDFLVDIGVSIDSEVEKLAFEELRKFANEKYSKGRWAKTSNYYAELSSLISHFISENAVK